MGSDDVMLDDLRLFSRGNILTETELNAMVKVLVGIDTSEVSFSTNSEGTDVFAIGSNINGSFIYDTNGSVDVISWEKSEGTRNTIFLPEDNLFLYYKNSDILHTGPSNPIVKRNGSVVDPTEYEFDENGRLTFYAAQSATDEIRVDDLLVIYKINFIISRDTNGIFTGIQTQVI